ncbi:MAG: DNA recombination protein RmuC [Candidatus Eisenbacteria bacterium]|nr:DNA recombination protein RmuC [Candidatus Eisenbacteria bacterium]
MNNVAVVIPLLLVNVVLLLIVIWRLFRRGRDETEHVVRDELRAQREESLKAARELREEVTGGFKSASDTIAKTIGEMGSLQKMQLEAVTRQLRDLTETNQSRFDALREVIDTQLKQIQESNEKKLDEMRKTVDEKLHDTLERRLGESFKLVSERLEAVQRGLGEMQTLATGVGDLKRVLTNVKARGTWAEFQLGAILEEILTPDQYARNVQTKEGSRETVEYAIRLPGPDNEPGTHVWLPIDSKFPQEDYLRLLEAAEAADSEKVQEASKALASAVVKSALDIRNRYIDPPHTTDFALMFLPTEGLYAEVLRQPGLVEKLQQTHRVVVAGPTTLAAILNSLRMGFRSLAIQQRASEVWKVLAAVKTEFGRFEEVLRRVKKQLDTASKTIDETSKRTQIMEAKLRDVERLPAGELEDVLVLPDSGAPESVSGEPDEEEVEGDEH